MYLIAYHPETNEVICSEPWPAGKPMDCHTVAEGIAHNFGTAIDDSGGYVLNCSGDLRVEFRRDPGNAVAIFYGESFYFRNLA